MRSRKVIVSCFAVIAVVCVLFFVWVRSPKGRILGDSRFYVTQEIAAGRMGFHAPHRTHYLVREIASAWNGIWKRPVDATDGPFPPTETRTCSIAGLLEQATRMTGVRYAIARPVVEGVGAVEFGHTNTLDVEEWVSAFKDALQSGRPEWVNDINSRFDRLNPRKENLVVITNSPDLILIVPREWSVDFQPPE
jgi:hypothetical protein